MLEWTADVKEVFEIGLIGFFLAALTSACAWFYGYYTYPEDARREGPSSLPLSAVVGAFLIFLSVSLLIVPGTIYGWYALVKEQFLDDPRFSLDKAVESWINIGMIVFTCFLIGVYLMFLPQTWIKSVFGDNFMRSARNVLKDFEIGAISWLVSYPLVLVVSSFISVCITYFYGKLEIDQLAVKELKATAGNSFLWIAMIFSIVVLVPIMEEVLFRGFFQTWLKEKIDRIWAIVLSSLLFAFFHFSTAQGMFNIELIPALFVLSCYLGFIFERQRSLLAPITLHSLFNAISVVMIFN